MSVTTKAFKLRQENLILDKLYYMFWNQCEEKLGEDQCMLRAGHRNSWHTKDGVTYWGDKKD